MDLRNSEVTGAQEGNFMLFSAVISFSFLISSFELLSSNFIPLGKVAGQQLFYNLTGEAGEKQKGGGQKEKKED